MPEKRSDGDAFSMAVDDSRNVGFVVSVAVAVDAAVVDPEVVEPEVVPAEDVDVEVVDSEVVPAAVVDVIWPDESTGVALIGDGLGLEGVKAK